MSEAGPSGLRVEPYRYTEAEFRALLKHLGRELADGEPLPKTLYGRLVVIVPEGP